MSFSDFKIFEHIYKKSGHTVYFAGEGPPIIIIHELPGLTVESFHFAERLIRHGYSAYIPHLFGNINKKQTILNFTKLCISKEFKIFARNETSPIVDWLRSLSAELFSKHKGRGVGAIGMCITGSFAIPLLINSPVIAPVLSQPAAPIQSAGNHLGFHKRSFGISKIDLKLAKEKVINEKLEIKIYRFKHDNLSPIEKINSFKEYFGNDLINYYELPTIKPCHSVFVHDFEEDPTETNKALEDLINFYNQYLK